jgi:GNAT superfamily N-acetyltransferase
MHTQIRRAEPKDAPTIAEFNQRLAWETEHKKLDTAIVTRGVSRVFDDAKRGFYLLAEYDGHLAGQLMITYEWSDWRDGWVWWIQSVYVREEYRRQGIFRTLYQAIVDEAKAAGDVVGIRLYVERENQRAQQTYRQLGMSDAGYTVEEVMFE